MPLWQVEYERKAEKQLEAIRDERLLVQIKAAIEPKTAAKWASVLQDGIKIV